MRFHFIDEIVDMVAGQRVHGSMTLPAEEELFEDHFPGFPVVPGVLLIEMMAQASGKCLDAENRSRGKAMLAQVRHASFRRWTYPGERLEVFAEITASTASFASATCRVECGSDTVADAELLFTFVPYTRLAPGLRDEVLERYLRRSGASPEDELA